MGFRAAGGTGGPVAETRRRLVAGWGWWLPMLEVRRFDLAPPGVVVAAVSKPRLDMMTDEGGELWGVSFPLPMVDRSLESMLEMESRSCWPFVSGCSCSSVRSITRVR